MAQDHPDGVGRVYDYVVVDVFTQTRFAGNPLAVVLDGSGLSDREMQAIAAEFNFSETTFVLPPDAPEDDARVRIFTKVAEIPFAGHPNVGTAVVLGREGTVFGRPVRERLRFAERAGPVTIELTRSGDQVAGARVAAPQPFERMGDLDPGLIAAAAGLSASDVATDRHAPTMASVGLPFCIAEIGSLDALSRATPDLVAFAAAAASTPAPREGGRMSLQIYTRLADDRVRARMFAPLSDLMEDPATGSAAAALGGLTAELSGAPAAFALEQGVEMGRPSRIDVAADGAGGVTIAGGAVEVMRGRLFV